MSGEGRHARIYRNLFEQLPKLTRSEIAVFLIIRYSASPLGMSSLTTAYIVKLSGCSERQTWRAINALVNKKLIKMRVRNGRAWIYQT